MFKKIALATALVATASFATWNKFPVPENHKGQAKVGFTYTMQGDYSLGDLYAGVRYTVIPNLDLATIFDYTLFTDYDGVSGPDGIANLPIMVRYQFMPTMNAFLDFTLPIGDEDLNDDGLGFHLGVQYSQVFGQIEFGSELGFTFQTEGDDKTSDPYELNIGAEGDYLLNDMFCPYVGLDLMMMLGETTHDGESAPGADQSGTIGLMPYLGVAIAINPMFTVDISAAFGIGEDYFGEETPIILDANLKINF